MPLTDEDREWLRDMVMFAKKYSLATLSIRLAMIERILDQEPPKLDPIEARLEALLKLYESKAEKWQSLTETATLIASEWEQCDRQRAEKAEAELERLRKDFAQETERAEKAEKEYESARAMLRNAYRMIATQRERAEIAEKESARAILSNSCGKIAKATQRERAEKAEAELERLKALLKRYESSRESSVGGDI